MGGEEVEEEGPWFFVLFLFVSLLREKVEMKMEMEMEEGGGGPFLSTSLDLPTRRERFLSPFLFLCGFRVAPI